MVYVGGFTGLYSLDSTRANLRSSWLKLDVLSTLAVSLSISNTPGRPGFSDVVHCTYRTGCYRGSIDLEKLKVSQLVPTGTMQVSECQPKATAERKQTLARL